jgi:GNAT superfamily N-acetyltransferase
MQIHNLYDNMSYVDQIVDWIYDEFINGIRAGVAREAVFEMFINSNKNSLPVTLLAFEDNICIGSISLVENDLKLRSYTPWLASLYVEKQFRNHGVGTALINEIIKVAQALDYNDIYLRTEHSVDYYRKLNWTFLESVIDEYGLETSLFKKNIKQ